MDCSLVLWRSWGRLLFFFFKQKTAYEMRISDWSSDVCSSDLEVRRALPTQGLDRLGPFIFLDHMGPFPVKPGAKAGFPEHPHAGIETPTYILERTMAHRHTIGNASILGPGEAPWLRAGRALFHDATPRAPPPRARPPPPATPLPPPPPP